MKQKKNMEKGLFRIIVCVILAVFFVLPFTQTQKVHALVFEVDEDNDVEFEVTHKAAGPKTEYRYATGAWYIRLATKDNIKYWNGAKSELEETAYINRDDTLAVGGEWESTNPAPVVPEKAFTAYYKLNGGELVEWLTKQYEKNKSSLHTDVTRSNGKVTRKVTFIANKVAYAYTMTHYKETGSMFNDSGPLYNQKALWNYPIDNWGVKWSGKRDRFKELYGQSAYVTLRAAEFSIKLVNTSGKEIKNPGGEAYAFPYNEVFYKEAIPSITAPQIDGYNYMGYEWRKDGKLITHGDGNGTVTEAWAREDTVNSNIGSSLTLTFIYQPMGEEEDEETSIPITAAPITQTPPEIGGNVTVTFDAAGGSISQESKRVTYGETYGQIPTPTKTGYVFRSWYYISGYNGNPDIGGSRIVTGLDNVLVEADHTLLAIYDPAPAGPTEEPTPEPTPTVDKEYYRHRYEYFTTDKGYTLDAIANDDDKPLSSVNESSGSAIYDHGGSLPDAAQTKRTQNYTKGTDASGNTWYFIPSGTSATYVHPAIYNGYNACNEQVKYITELNFPATITSGGTSYTVISVGGGGATYHTISSSGSATSVTRTDYRPHIGSYIYDYAPNEIYSYYRSIYYTYGVLGNGYITSYANADENRPNYYIWNYADHDYYVYNTTLKKVTVPQGVAILDGAFIYCQALEEVNVSGATEFKSKSFSAATMLVAQLSVNTQYYDSTGTKIFENIRYLYNESYNNTAKTQVMLDWEEWSALAPKVKFSELTRVTAIRGEAFSYRDNMYDLTFGSSLSTVQQHAFIGSKLKSVTFKGTGANIEITKERTLGTNMPESRTKIYCPGGATSVIRYGMKWHKYYELICGYNVTYKPNGGKIAATGLATDYVTRTAIRSVLPGIKNVDEFILDTNGHVWYYSGELLQRIDALTGYNIKSFEEDITNGAYASKKLYWFETTSGDVYVAYMSISYAEVKVYDVKHLFNINSYADYGYGGGWSSSGISYGAFVDTQSSTASKRYKLYRISTSGNTMTVTTSTNRYCPYRQTGTGNSSPMTYWEAEPEITINGTKVTFQPEGSSKSYTYTGSGNGYVKVEKLLVRKDSYSSYGEGGGGSYYYKTYYYALWDSSGVRSVVAVTAIHSIGSTTTGTFDNCSISVGSSREYKNFSIPLESIHRYSSEEFLGRGTNGTWYVVETEGSMSQDNGLYVKVSHNQVTVPSGVNGIKNLYYTTDGTIYLLDKNGDVWTGRSPASLAKQTLPEKITELRQYDDLILFTGASGAIYAKGPKAGIGEKFGMTSDYSAVTALAHLKEGIDAWDYIDYGIYIKGNSLRSLSTGEELFYSESGYNLNYIDKDLVVVGNRLYECSTKKLLVNLGATYTIYDEMIITNGNIYRRKDGIEAMKQGADFTYSLILDENIFLNNGTLYYKDTLKEVPGLTDSYKFVFVAEEADLMERYGYSFRFWNTRADGRGTTYYPGEETNATSDITVYAQWKEDYNIVRFEPGAEDVLGTMEDMLLPIYQTVTTLPANMFKRPGYVFAGWGIAEDGSVVFKDKDTIGNVKGLVILYAKWKPNAMTYSLTYMKYPYGTLGNTAWKSKTLSYTTKETVEGQPYTPTGYTVSYNKNTNSSMSTASTATLQTLTAENTTSKAATFDKWKWYERVEDPAGYEYMGQSFKKGETVFGLTEKNGDVVYFYPSWKGDGASVILPDGTCEGYFLAGWSESADASGTVYEPGLEDGGVESRYTPVKHTTLYAVWEPEEKVIELDGMGADEQEQTEVTFIFDAKVPEKVIIPVREHYVFQGYYTALNFDGSPAEGSVRVYDKYGSAITNAGGEVMAANNKNGLFDDIGDTLYAYWLPDKALVYDPNYTPLDEDCPAMETTWVEEGKTGAWLTKNEFTRLGYHFVNWNRNADGSGDSYEDEAYVANITSRWIMYAQWKANKYLISYDLKGNRPNASTETEIETAPTEMFYDELFTVTNPEKRGYTFLGWDITEMSDCTHTYGSNTTTESSLTEIFDTTFKNLHHEEGKTVTFTAKWKVNTYEVKLDVRGATSQGVSTDAVNGHTEKVTMTFDADCPDITVPSKRGYSFEGYYTGIRGTGTKYYDNNGKSVAPWTETEVGTLYACWKQRQVELPEEDDYTGPEVPEEQTIRGNVGRTDGKGLLYADDYNSATGALTDLQPYLTYDTPASTGVIPGTELLSFRAKMGNWMLNYRFHKNTGKDYVKITVTVPYRTQYEIYETEELVISDLMTEEYTFLVPKAWSYWEVVESGLYYPDSITVASDILEGGSFTVSVDRSTQKSVDLPNYEATNHGGKKAHVKWPECDADGTPVLSIELEEEQYIISDKPDTPPDADRHNKIVGKNAALAEDSEALVRSDAFVFNGETVLSDAWQTQHGAEIDKEKLPQNAEMVELTSYEQTYASGIGLDDRKPNGRYETTATIIYTGDAGNIGTSATKTVELADINDLNIHTPVACKGVITEGTEGTTDEDGNELQVLTLKEALNFFTLHIDNTGTHLMSLGYGHKDFSTALSGKSNIAAEDGSLLNQVQFPFDVYVDMGNDSRKADGSYDTKEDFLLKAGRWFTTGVESQRFYIPVTEENGKYTINFRCIAVNCPREKDFQENKVNLCPQNYVAKDSLKIEIKSYIKEFRIVSVEDPRAMEQLKKGSEVVTLKKGYGFTYQLLTQGEFFGESVEIQMIPNYVVESYSGNKRQKVELFLMDKLITEESRECYAWEVEPLLLQKNYGVILQMFLGRGFIPTDVWCVPMDKIVTFENYVKQQTVTGKEDFFIQNGYLIISFNIRVKSNRDKWYIYNTGEVIRYDLKKSVDEDYEIGGME